MFVRWGVAVITSNNMIIRVGPIHCLYLYSKQSIYTVIVLQEHHHHFISSNDDSWYWRFLTTQLQGTKNPNEQKCWLQRWCCYLIGQLHHWRWCSCCIRWRWEKNREYHFVFRRTLQNEGWLALLILPFTSGRLFESLWNYQCEPKTIKNNMHTCKRPQATQRVHCFRMQYSVCAFVRRRVWNGGRAK